MIRILIFSDFFILFFGFRLDLIYFETIGAIADDGILLTGWTEWHGQRYIGGTTVGRASSWSRRRSELSELLEHPEREF